MSIGTSIGGFYEDEHAYNSRHSRPPQSKDPNELHPDSLIPPDKPPLIKASMNAGFHQSDNLEDRRNEFFDPRTDPHNTLPPGTYRLEDLDDPEGNAPNTSLGIQLGATRLDVLRTKQIDEQIQWMMEQKDKADTVWPELDKEVFPPGRKTDEEIRNESGG